MENYKLLIRSMPELIASGDIEYILKKKLGNECKLLDYEEADNLIMSIIIEGKTDKQIYHQLNFLGRELKSGRVELLRFCLKYAEIYKNHEMNSGLKRDMISTENLIFCNYFLRYFKKCHWSFELSPVCQACRMNTESIDTNT